MVFRHAWYLVVTLPAPCEQCISRSESLVSGFPAVLGAYPAWR